jgi:hypothetical protein
MNARELEVGKSKLEDLITLGCIEFYKYANKFRFFSFTSTAGLKFLKEIAQQSA